jgi:hypothetical protein
MHFYNFKLSNLPLFIIGALAVAGCFRPGTHSATDAGGGMASFTVAPVKGAAIVTEQDESFSIPIKKRFDLVACLKDRRTELEIKNTRFIMAIDGDESAVVSDEKGCVNWSEEIRFNYLGEEHYLHRNRMFKAADGGRHSGSQAIEVALDPWNFSGTNPEVVDLGSGPTPETVKVIEHADFIQAMREGSASLIRTLGIDQFSLSSLPAAEGAGFNRVIELTIHPVFEVKDASGSLHRIDLKDAKLKISATLVALISGKDGAETPYIAWSTTDAMNLQKSNSTSNKAQKADLAVSFIPQSPETARYQLIVKIEPVFGPNSLAAFEGVFNLGSHAQLSTSVVLPEKISEANSDGGTFSYNNAIRGLAPLTVPASAPSTN